MRPSIGNAVLAMAAFAASTGTFACRARMVGPEASGVAVVKGCPCALLLAADALRCRVGGVTWPDESDERPNISADADASAFPHGWSQ
jgi:hypothetical protein